MQTEAFPFQNKINWVPSADAVIRLLEPGHTFIQINGDINLSWGLKIPFKQRYDIEQYLIQFAKDKIADVWTTVKDLYNEHSN